MKESSLTSPNAEYPEKETLRLLLLAKEGDEASFACLAEKFKPLLEAAVAQYRAELLPQDIEELSQEALVAFHSAVKSYDPSYKNVSFGLYAKICVNKQYRRKQVFCDLLVYCIFKNTGFVCLHLRSFIISKTKSSGTDNRP